MILDDCWLDNTLIPVKKLLIHSWPKTSLEETWNNIVALLASIKSLGYDIVIQIWHSAPMQKNFEQFS